MTNMKDKNLKLKSRVCSDISNAKMKVAKIGKLHITIHNLPKDFLRHYPSFNAGKLNISELARVCDLSRTTVYKYISLLEQ